MAALPPPLIPDNAPFDPAQRAWLNGFFAGLLNLEQMGGAAGLGQGAAALAGMAKETGAVPADAAQAAAAAGGQDEDFDAPWHDPALELPERMDLAEGKPLPQRLMAAMGQLDCGQCGYDCKAYALKLADGSEAKQNLCVPGGRATQKKVKELLNERGSADQVAAEAAVSGQSSGVAGTLAGTNGHAAPAKVPSGINGTAVAAVAAVTAVAATAVAAVAGIGRANPVTAMLKAARALNAPDSEKDTRHVVIDLEGTGITYKAGDSLGVIPENDPELVDGIVAALGADPDAEVVDGDGPSRPLRAELLTRRDLRNPTDALFALLAEAATDKDEAIKLSLLADGEDPDGDLETLDVLDVLERFASARPAKAVVHALDELQPRLYSISSSPTAHAGEVHLTVGVVHEEQRGRKRRGVASNHLGRVNGKALPLQIYLQPSHGFALPEDDTKPVVMVGPGTGIAPFRAFLHERKARGAKGKSWLFFGNPYGDKDFLYREEIEELRRDGALTRLDTAFSRDQAEKVYVQQRILEAGPELWSWLNQEGGHVYVCGDAKRMASDVDKALREVACRQGGMDEAGAKAWLKSLADAGRYQRDVY